MDQDFLSGDDDEDLDSLIAGAIAQMLDEAQQVVDGVERPGRNDPLTSGLPCHPALTVYWTEGDAGFTDWFSGPSTGRGSLG